MSPIVTDTSPASMAYGVEENLIACFTELAAARGSVREDDGITTIITGIPVGAFNGVFRAHFPSDLPRDQLDARISATLGHLNDVALPYTWYVMPSSWPVDLGERLVARGLRLSEAAPGMAADLHALHETGPMPDGLEIEPVREMATLRTWLRTGFAGFGIPSELEDPFFALISEFALGPGGPAHYYLGRLDGQPVATSLSVFGGGVVGLYNIATVPEHRGKGIGAAMTLAPIHDARAQGYRIAILEASPMGFPVYQRLGFRQYITIRHYAPGQGAH